MTLADAKSRPPARSRHWRLIRNFALAATALVVVSAMALLWYVHTDSFRDMVHARLIAALENITGGRVELAKLSIVPFRFRVEAHDLTIHGTEAAGQVPYAHVDLLTAEIKIISLFERQYGFHSLVLNHPVVHIIVYPDGSTNQPAPRAPARTEVSPVQQLFAVSINHLQITRGELIWNNQKIPLEFTAGDASAGLNYSLLHGNYEALLRLRNVETRLHDLRPLTSTVAAHLVLGQNYAIINSFEWSAGESRLEASGRLDNFQNPKLTGNFNGRVHLTDLASIQNVPQLHGGILEVGGKGSWALQDYLFTGKAAVKNLEWRDSHISLRNANASANYAVSSTALQISGIEAHVLGGSATGSLESVNWLSPEAHPKKRRDPQQQRGSLNLKLRDLSIAALAAAVRSRRLPLDHLHLAGMLSGTVASKWTGSVQRAESDFSLSALPPPQTRAGEIPITATANGVYRGATDELDLANLNLASRATQIQASGKLSTSAILRILITSSDLHEWQPLLAAIGDPRIPITLHGRASFSGNASGRLSDFAIAGHLQASNFDSLLPGSDGQQQRTHWDSLAADIHASPQTVSARNGTLAHGSTLMRFDASATLKDGEFVDSSPIAAHVQIHRAELADVTSLAGYNFSATGTVDLSLTASGTKADPHGDGHLELRNGSFYGQPLARLSSDVHFGGHEIQLNNATAIYRDGQIAGGAAYNLQTRGFRFRGNGTNFDLVHFSQLQAGKITVTGKLDFTAQGDGTLDAPVVNANVRVRDLTFDNERAGDFTFDAVTRGAEMQLTGRSNFENAQLAMDGAIHVRGDWPARLALRFEALDIDSVLRPYLGTQVTSHVPAAGTLQITGPLLHPALLSASGDITSLSGNLENFALHNEGPIHFTVEKQVLALNRLRLVGDGTDLTAQGTLQLAGGHDLDVRSDGRLNLKLIDGMSEGLSGSGLVSVAVRVSGTYETPVLAGQLAVANGSISSIDLPNGLSEMNGTLVFNQDRLQIETLTARVGGGNVDFSGFMTYSPHINFNVKAEAHEVRLRPAGISATSDAELHLTGSSRDALLSGEITVLKLNLTPGFDFARYLEGFRQTSSLPEGSSLLNNLRLDIHVVTTPELQMEAASAKVSGDADLRLRGTLLRPVLLGRVDILEGDVYFSGTKYRLERGEITFIGPTGIKPALDLEATTRVRDYDITLGVNGTPDKLNMTYRSEPPLPSADIVALLALGHTESESSLADTSSQSVSQQASSAILSQALNATLSSRSQRLFGITRIKVDPNGLNTETTPTRAAPAVTLEQQVSSNLTLTYSTEVSQTSQQVIQGEYNVSRSISILGVRDQNGVVSFDILLRHRRK
ncbi:MAG TPA: translocation/assembly module TamB domain-containing protein [Terriglobales bacterium]